MTIYYHMNRMDTKLGPRREIGGMRRAKTIQHKIQKNPRTWSWNNKVHKLKCNTAGRDWHCIECKASFTKYLDSNFWMAEIYDKPTRAIVNAKVFKRLSDAIHWHTSKEALNGVK